MRQPFAVPKWGLGPPNDFLGAKNYTVQRARFCIKHSYGANSALPLADALKRHERVNVFNLVER